MGDILDELVGEIYDRATRRPSPPRAVRCRHDASQPSWHPLLLLVRRFFSADEIAFNVHQRAPDAPRRRRRGTNRVALAIRIYYQFDDALSAILIATNLVNMPIVAGDGGGPSASPARPGRPRAAAMTVIIVLLGEINPKILASATGRLARKTAYPLRLIMLALRPASSHPFSSWTRWRGCWARARRPAPP
jgi:CBS domain containing-hemolysin-like protein